MRSNRLNRLKKLEENPLHRQPIFSGSWTGGYGLNYLIFPIEISSMKYTLTTFGNESPLLLFPQIISLLILVWESHSCTRCTKTFNIRINIWSLSAGNFSIKTILWESHSREVMETLNYWLLGTNNFLHPATTTQKEKLSRRLSCLH